MSNVTIQRTDDRDAVQAFADAEFEKLDPVPWRSAQITLAAERDGALIGAVRASYDAGIAHLSELIVAADERNNGTGAQLLAAFEAWAREQGAHRCTLHTDRDRPAVRFYERHGWHIAYIMPDHYQHRTFLLMTKEIHRNE